LIVVVFVYLVLVGQYEGFLLPLAVILSLPVGLLGSFLFLQVRGSLRFRPILMTSFAFIAGLLPLVDATGPGAIGNRTIGTASVGGRLVGTLIGVLVIPGLSYLFGRIADKRYLLKDEADEPLSKLFEHKE
jgi:HAE1 family hydrophobic/amphiphilic exporter-1